MEIPCAENRAHRHFTALLLFLHHVPASAQRRWDIAPFGGIVAVNAPVEGETEGYRENWFHTGQWGVTLGWHLSTHLKLEIDAAATGTGTQFVQRIVTVPGQPGRYPVGAEAEDLGALPGRAGDVAVLRQRVGPSLRLRRCRRAVRSPQRARVGAELLRRQSPFHGNQIVLVPEGREGPTTTTRVSGVLAAAPSSMSTSAAFFRTGRPRVAAAPAHQSLSFRAGLGFDF